MEKAVSILFAVVMLFATCTRNLADISWIGVFVIDLCLLAIWCVFTFCVFAKDWHVVSPIGFVLMLVTLGMLFLQLNYRTPLGIIAFFANVTAVAFLITAMASYGKDQGTYSRVR